MSGYHLRDDFESCSDLRSDARTTNEPSDSEHTIFHSGGLQDTANGEDDDCHNDRVLSRQLIREPARKQSTDQSAEFKHSSHEALPKASTRGFARHAWETIKELIHYKRHRDNALIVSKEKTADGRERRAHGDIGVGEEPLEA